MEPHAGGPGFMIWLTIGATSCFGLLLLVYNVFGVVSLIRDKRDERPASPMSLAAWGVSLASLFLGPCALIPALLALVLARVESGRIFAEQSSMRSTGPVHMANVNAAIAIVLAVVYSLMVLFSFLG